MHADHPLRTIREIANAALGALSGEFEAIYATGFGHPSIPPDPTTFDKDRDRLLGADGVCKFLAAIATHLEVKRLLSIEHFSVDGALVETWPPSRASGPKTDWALRLRPGAMAGATTMARAPNATTKTR